MHIQERKSNSAILYQKLISTNSTEPDTRQVEHWFHTEENVQQQIYKVPVEHIFFTIKK